MTKEYRIAIWTNLDETDYITELINDGWELVGGVGVCQIKERISEGRWDSDPSYLFAQAMVKQDD